MKLILLLIASLLAVISANEELDPKCEYCLNNQCYIDSKFKKPYLRRHNSEALPALYWKENILYTTRDGESVYINIDEGSIAPFYVAKRNPYINITNVRGHAVDQETNKVYIWAQKGKSYKENVFVYDPTEKTTVALNLTSDAIQEMHIKDQIYYACKKMLGVNVLNNGISSPLYPLRDAYLFNFILDRLGDLYVSTHEGLQRLKKDGTELTLLRAKNFYSCFWVTVDKDGNLFVLDPENQTILKLDYVTDELIEVGATDTKYNDRFVFDKHDNILYYGQDRFDNTKRKAWIYIVPNGQCTIQNDSKGKKKIIKT